MEHKEKLVFYTNRTPILLVFRILFGIIILDIILVLIFFFVDFVDIDYNGLLPGYSYEEHIVILFLIIHIVFILYLFTNWFFDYYKIYLEKVEHIQGIFFKKKQLFIIEKINTISVYQSFFGKIFNYGDISFFYDEKDFKLKNVPYPEEFVEFLEFFRKVEKNDNIKT